MAPPFVKRHYLSLPQFWVDLRALTGQRAAIRDAMRALEPSFRERLMLAVTGVNGCRMCSYYHSKAALESGISDSEVKAMLARDTGGAPEEELPALLYAQHYAGSGGQPSEAAGERLRQVYGAKDAGRIQTVIRMIQAANLMGNSWDYFIYRLTRGRRGL